MAQGRRVKGNGSVVRRRGGGYGQGEGFLRGGCFCFSRARCPSLHLDDEILLQGRDDSICTKARVGRQSWQDSAVGRTVRAGGILDLLQIVWYKKNYESVCWNCRYWWPSLFRPRGGRAGWSLVSLGRVRTGSLLGLLLGGSRSTDGRRDPRRVSMRTTSRRDEPSLRLDGRHRLLSHRRDCP